jgi:hypothetical protein
MVFLGVPGSLAVCVIVIRISASFFHAKPFERDVAALPCRRVPSNAVGPVTQHSLPSSGCAARQIGSLRRTDVTFDGQNNTDNSCQCHTRVQLADIVGLFWRRYDPPVRFESGNRAARMGEIERGGFQQAVCHAPGIIFPISRALMGTTFLQWLPRRSLQFADGYVATDVEPRSAAHVSGSGCRRNLAFT